MSLASGGALLVLLICGGGAQAQPTNSVKRALTLDDCIQMALTHNLDLQIERYNPVIARYALRGAYGAYDPVFRFNASEAFVSSPEQMDPKKTAGDEANETTVDAYGAGIGGLAATGLRYGLNAGLAWREAKTFFPSPPPGLIRLTNEWSAVSELTLRQPLLRNLWIDLPRQVIRVHKKNLKMAELALRQLILNTVTQVQIAYYELIFAREQIQVMAKALELAKELLAENQKRVQAGMLPPLDEKQAEAQVAAGEAALFAAQQVFAEQQTALKRLIHDDLKGWAEVVLEPVDQLTATPPLYDREESWDQALANRPDLQQFRLEVEKRDVLVRYQLNQVFPSVDLVGSYGARAARNSLGDAVNDLTGAARSSYSYGVVLSVPIRNLAARNNYQLAKALKEQGLLQLRKLEQTILAQVEVAGRLTQSTFHQVTATHQARQSAELALAMEQRKLAAGATTFFVVLQLQRDLTEARSAELRALVDYHKAVAQLAFGEGSTLERNRLAIEHQ
jgi:outer membrane protein TolC